MRTAAKYTLIAGALVLLIGILLSRSVADPTPSPTASTRCWIYAKIYKATPKAYADEHATLAEQQLVQKWVKKVPVEKRPLVRWMRGLHDGGVLVFLDTPLNENGTETVWQALNYPNVMIDPERNCEVFPMPGA